MITQAHRRLLREAYWHIKNGTEKEVTKQKDNEPTTSTTKYVIRNRD